MRPVKTRRFRPLHDSAPDRRDLDVALPLSALDPEDDPRRPLRELVFDHGSPALCRGNASNAERPAGERQSRDSGPDVIRQHRAAAHGRWRQLAADDLADRAHLRACGGLIAQREEKRAERGSSHLTAGLTDALQHDLHPTAARGSRIGDLLLEVGRRDRLARDVSGRQREPVQWRKCSGRRTGRAIGRAQPVCEPAGVVAAALDNRLIDVIASSGVGEVADGEALGCEVAPVGADVRGALGGWSARARGRAYGR